ncbi:MAG: ABC transporter permease subunit [Hyphomicrobiaceae bacterium]|nr:ABC transporter permease subunit [Hyphomicrobiaceae bacterium]
MTAIDDAVAATPVVRGSSLWTEARHRLMRNRAAVVGLVVLALIAALAVIGPLVSPHDYDKVYSDYVKVGPGLAAHPSPEQAQELARKTASRMRAQVDAIEPVGDGLRISLSATRPIDDRLAVYFDRSDAFANTRVIEKADEGRKLVIETTIEHAYFPFGTDANGRDMATRILIGARISLAIGLLASFVALIIGVTWGATAGYLGGRIDNLMMRIVDILYSLPFIFFVIMLVVFFGRNFVLMFLAVGAVEWLDMARIVRGQTLSLKRQEYVQAAEAMGVDTLGILKRHIIPNTLGTVIVFLTLLVPRVILIESFMSFLGLGVQEPLTSLGVLIAEGAKSLQEAPFLLIFPSVILVGMLFSLNFIGDGLRDALDPKDR